MKDNWPYLYNFLRSLLAILLIGFFCRLFFYVSNFSYFQEISLSTFIGGFHFDLSTAAMFYPLFFISLFFQNHFFSLLTFHLSNSLFLLLNFIDTYYFPFSKQRMKTDIFSLLSSGGDFFDLLPSYLIDYWLLFLFYLLAIVGSHFFIKKALVFKENNNSFKFKIVEITIICVLLIVFARGSLSSRPLDIVDAAKYGSSAHIPLIINTPFQLIKNIQRNELVEMSYFDFPEAFYQPIKQIVPIFPERKYNVVVIILESVGKEYVGALNEGKQTFTPFLDSLINESMVFENCFANGSRSVEAIPSIFCGAPSLIDNGLIFSRYAGNEYNSLASSLQKRGYHTSFFHGANNGSMNFDSFSKAIGFQHYYGKNEYNNNKDFDGNWGIFDEPFFQFFAEKLNNTPTPFLTSVFSLSSHHPYAVPEKYENKFTASEHPLLQSVQYTDYALKQFFEKAKKSTWFANTLFVITADHTALAFEDKYKRRTGKFAVPLVFFHPTDTFFHHKRYQTIVQHADIYPSIMNVLGMKEQMITFGSSFFDHQEENFTINYYNNTYHYFQKGYDLLFDGTKVNIPEDNQDTMLYFLENKIKSIVQQYNYRVINNKFRVENE
jgi:hypothetical protein